ncbi:hypothetical protein [Desulfobacter vibrioformis]|uniref:hypothetical protein n=1 Tax=Desulfobacter vibrioformis TaxID=34031 RepID=UPI000553A742|nr:hypothetical protein [Desulfobacter vibrioformis]
MRINDDHMYHGAALTQIAEHELFTSINAVRFSDRISRSAFRINETIGIYLKYASKPSGLDYTITFSSENKQEIKKLCKICNSVFIAMVCVQERQICCLTEKELDDWFIKRNSKLGNDEDISTILVNLPKGKSFRVNMNLPGRRKRYLDTAQLIPRKRFPDILFK